MPCAAPGYIDRRGSPRTPEELDGHQLLGFFDPAARTLIDREGGIGSFDPHGSGGRLVINDGLSHKLVTINGAGISSNSIWSVYQDFRTRTLVLTDYEVDERAMLWLDYPKSNVLTTKGFGARLLPYFRSFFSKRSRVRIRAGTRS